MAQFEIISVGFTASGELEVTIDNENGMALHEDPTHDVPSDVEQVPTGGTPTQDLWVHRDNYHLTITLSGEGGDNPLVVSNTGYYNGTEDLKYVDIVTAEYTATGKKGRKVRRRANLVRKTN